MSHCSVRYLGYLGFSQWVENASETFEWNVPRWHEPYINPIYWPDGSLGWLKLPASPIVYVNSRVAPKNSNALRRVIPLKWNLWLRFRSMEYTGDGCGTRWGKSTYRLHFFFVIICLVYTWTVLLNVERSDIHM